MWFRNQNGGTRRRHLCKLKKVLPADTSRLGFERFRFSENARIATKWAANGRMPRSPRFRFIFLLFVHKNMRCYAKQCMYPEVHSYKVLIHWILTYICIAIWIYSNYSRGDYISYGRYRFHFKLVLTNKCCSFVYVGLITTPLSTLLIHLFTLRSLIKCWHLYHSGWSRARILLAKSVHCKQHT